MSNNHNQTVLKAWHMMESIEPCKVEDNKEGIAAKHFTDNQKRNNVKRLQDLTEKPWERDKLNRPDTHKLEYQLYLGCFKQYKLVEIFRELFQNDEEIINRDKTELCSFTFKVDQDGNYIEDSIFVPMVMYMIKSLTSSSSFSYTTMKDDFEEVMQEFKEKVNELFIDGITNDSIEAVTKTYRKYFYQLEKSNGHYIETKRLKKDTETTDDNMNSFYVSDIGNILNKGVNKTLSEYIQGRKPKERVNVNENSQYIESVLQPKNVPNGRWPSPVNHRLSLMQQVAVNQVLQNNQKINSVNGPPGTGKTTLLKDIFADLIVQRATEMTKLNKPQDAFTKQGSLEMDGYHFPVYQLHETLSKFSMVVASSNNGAVENISKELPALKEVCRMPPEKDPFPSYENKYREEAESLSMFSNVAETLLGNKEEAWGLFSAALGNSNNLDTFSREMIKKEANYETFMNQLTTNAEQMTEEDWKEAVDEFQQLLDSVQEKKDDLQKFAKAYENIKSKMKILTDLQADAETIEEEKKRLEAEITHFEELKAEKQELLDLLPQPSVFKRIFRVRDEKKEALKAEMYELTEKLSKVTKEYRQLKTQREKIKKQEEEIEKEKNELDQPWRYYEKQRIVLPSEKYWEDNASAYEKRQVDTLWMTDELNYERGLLFLKAMKLHKYLLQFNTKPVFNTLRLLTNKKQLDLNVTQDREALEKMWKSLHMITPVISTTFASFGSMYRGIGTDFIDYLFIDEAGQASPQQAAGGLWRAKRAVVVGDPLQIEPVVTTDKTVLEDLKRHFALEDRYIGTNASVQALADLTNPYGTYIGDGHWIGTPLWVHRRCKNPMFMISNKIAYENRMVLPSAQKETGKSIWFDCKGKAVNRHYVREQGEIAANQILARFHQEKQLPDVYVITPFTSVKEGLKQNIKNKFKGENVGENELKLWLKKAVGTVHTFQGKEADVVYVVTGTDPESDGAANWSCSTPNLLNVAVTRAKKELYVIGDYQRFSKKQYYQTIIEQIGEVRKEQAGTKE